ncbi:protein IWS1 homolog isoform X1 [Astyanax mexicanus]|uniref:protein IWS1 homolog isoform X1 n=1 Tax=Astyanax mexicanus TaxID=7994 RepID=UPI0020CAA2F8|nr:protein IWS1 homolog isoform X1 [Astyanax mexicanus]
MDGEDEVFSGSHPDDGSGTPVQDENALGSDAEEEMRGGSHHSEDEGSDREDAAPRGGDSGSEHEDGGGDGGSDSEAEHPRPADSDDDDSSPVKRRGSTSETEEQQKAQDSNSDEEPQKRPRRRMQSSDSGSESEGEKTKQRKRIESDEEEEKKDDEEDGVRKAAINSDSEDEEERKPREEEAGSDQDDEAPRRTIADSDDDEDEKPVKRKKAILSDSDDEEETKAVKKSRAVSDDDSDSDAGSEAPDKTVAAKLRELGSDSEEEDDRMKADTGKKDEKTLFGSDSDSDNNEEEKMIADIFGESGDEEGEEFTGFNQEELEVEKQQAKAGQKQVADDSDSDDDVDRGGKDTSFMSDFDIMLARKKAQSGKRKRHRDGGTFISDADDVVSAMITKMTEAAEEDRTLNSQKKPALKKLMLLPTVVMHLKKQDLKETFIDSGVMAAIKEWISPLPDKSLPALKIREELLKILQELPSVSQETLKMSGIGRAVMFLYKHPKESRPNKDLALKLINEWSRPIFGLSSNYKGMTREERQQRDLDQQIAPRRRLSEPQQVERAEEPDVFGPLSSGGQTPRRDLEKVLTGEEKALRPGDPGFCARARVPMPSNKDYVVRPKWNVESESSRGPVRKNLSRVDKQMRRFADIRRLTKPGHAVKISVEGNRMPL